MNHHPHRRHHHHRLKSWSDILSFKSSGRRTPTPDLSRSPSPPPAGAGAVDPTAALPDAVLLSILSLLPSPAAASLVSRRWLRLADRLRRRLTLLHLPAHPRVPLRFPLLTDLSLRPSAPRSPVLLSGPPLPDLSPAPPPPADIDAALSTLARGLPHLHSLSLPAPDSFQSGLLALAEHCTVLQHLDLRTCTDLALRPISAFHNLQVLSLTGPVTDIGLTILAHGCKRLVRLELGQCEGSYDGVSAVGKCCVMLEELVICDHRMDGGWLAAVGFFGSLRTLRLRGCRGVDADPGSEEHLVPCPTVELLEVRRCQLRDRGSFKALFVVCEGVREVVFHDCWGLDDDMFSVASSCRRVKSLSLEGCSRLTTEGLESVLLSWKDLERLTVVSCNRIKDEEVTPALANLFSILKGLKWSPDSKSVLAAGLAGTGMGKKGGRFFKRALRQRG